MHMADALISPAVGATFWVASAATLACSARVLRKDSDEPRIPLMGVLAAFIFAAQMINFTIPGTGSSGHLGGGLILAILLGPWAGFLAMASVLTVQALFFADGGLLALGCNIFNLGVPTCFIAYPLVYRPLIGSNPGVNRILAVSLLAAVVGLQLGAFGVVLETTFSGVAELPFNTFVLAMQPIHLAIGIIEGLVTAAVVTFIYKARPDFIRASELEQAPALSIRQVAVSLLVVALFTGGFASWFASEYPDGLEWSLAIVSGKGELESPEHGIHSSLASLQEKTALLPDYDFKGGEGSKSGTSTAGVFGGFLTLAIVGVIALVLRKKKP
ncbi:MAG: cobalamin biosynthesis protein CbiM [Deltaproteobacteria bacterium HGW-Deltaproteobacteria-4]|nr:MAG: cobalamin biosynthesis protein CbiM [Deltaproteobacteria bacterium HGW-Deltaproteobacteria-4]